LSILRKIADMKKFLIYSFLLTLAISVNAQENRIEALQRLEGNQQIGQNSSATATMKSASRLFKDKDDLTSVIMVIPQDSIVSVLGSDTTFLHVVYEGNEGYIYSRHAVINKSAAAVKPDIQQEPAITGGRPVQPRQKVDRYTFLENRYGPALAAKLYSGEIWKGMNSQLVQDSWGSPRKINRLISGNIVKEEWIYKNTWLYFQNNTLAEWGPVKGQ
jgi:hypothetical protein